MTVKPSIQARKKTQKLQNPSPLFPPERRPRRPPSERQRVVLFQKEKRARPIHFSNWLTDGKSLRFGLVSDQAAINQRAEEREACSEGRRREDKRSEWTDRINSWPWGSARRLPRAVMKRCHLRRSRPAKLKRLDEGALRWRLLSYIIRPRWPAVKPSEGEMASLKGQMLH